jgi:hypothetical protein
MQAARKEAAGTRPRSGSMIVQICQPYRCVKTAPGAPAASAPIRGARRHARRRHRGAPHYPRDAQPPGRRPRPGAGRRRRSGRLVPGSAGRPTPTPARAAMSRTGTLTPDATNAAAAASNSAALFRRASARSPGRPGNCLRTCAPARRSATSCWPAACRPPRPRPR